MSALEDSQAVLVPMQPLQYLPGGPLLLTMEGHRDAISALAATSLTMKQSGEAGLCIISSSWDKTLKSWDLNTTGVLKTFDGHTDRVLSVALTGDGQYTASGSADMTIRYIGERQRGEHMRILTLGRGRFECQSFPFNQSVVCPLPFYAVQVVVCSHCSVSSRDAWAHSRCECCSHDYRWLQDYLWII